MKTRYTSLQPSIDLLRLERENETFEEIIVLSRLTLARVEALIEAGRLRVDDLEAAVLSGSADLETQPAI